MHNTELRILNTEYFPLHTSHMNNRKSERESGGIPIPSSSRTLYSVFKQN